MNDSAVSASPALAPAAAPARKRLDFFERYLSFWVLACMVAGVAEKLSNDGSCRGPRGCCG